jgi:uncharacterized membrane protein YjjP (DUF1212 family)
LTELEIKVLAVTAMIGGSVQLVGSIVLLASAPTTHVAVFFGQSVSIGVGPEVAITGGVAMIVSGTLMLLGSQLAQSAETWRADVDQRSLAIKRGGDA